MLLCIFVTVLILSPVRAAHPLANWRASGAIFWKDAWHLAPSSWLLAVGWHCYVSFPRCMCEMLSIWKSNEITYDHGELQSEEWYLQTVRSDIKLWFPQTNLWSLFEEFYEVLCSHLFSLTGILSQTRLRSLARHSEWPTLCDPEWALQDGDAQGKLPRDEKQVPGSPL